MCSAPAMAPRDVVTCGPDGVPCATSRTESIAVVGKAWVEHRAQDLQDGLGHEPVKDRRDTEHPRPTAGLGQSHLAHRRWNVGRVQPLLSDGVPLRTEIGREVFDTHAVDTRCPLGGLHTFHGCSQVLSPQHLLQQRLGLWSDRVRARRCRVTHESRLMATSGRLRLAADLGRMGLDTHRVSNKVSKITSPSSCPP